MAAMRLEKMLDPTKDEVVIERFPPEMPAAQVVEITINDVKKTMLNAEGLVLLTPQCQPSQKRQERFSRLEIDFGKKVKLREMHINISTSLITCIGQLDSPLVLNNIPLFDTRSTLTTYYKRKNKNKILHAYFYLEGSHFLGIDKILSEYDQIFCFDTNCATTPDNKKIAVTTAIIAKPQSIAQSALFLGETTEYQSVAYDPPGNPEIYGIWMCFCHIYKEQPALLGNKIALITDTEYGLIKDWQTRSSPFFNGMNLPEGIDIFYATSDAGGDEFMPNRLIKKCDQLSANKIRELLKK